MQGKTIVITGATSGIGEIAAVAFAKLGARVIFTARDAARGAATLKKLQAAGGGDHRVVAADLMRIGEVKRAGAEIAALAPRIDVLANNAGALFPARQMSADGLEASFALNHMSYFVLTQALLPHLAPNARVVSTASAAHQGAVLDFDDLQSARGPYTGFSVYSRSKLCNILFTRALAKRLTNGITATCLHPGFVATRFGDGFGATGLAIGAAKLFALSPEKGADTLIWLASSADIAGESGGYYDRRKPGALSADAQNDADAARLWAISEDIAARA